MRKLKVVRLILICADISSTSNVNFLHLLTPYFVLRDQHQHDLQSTDVTSPRMITY